jgi:tetratricopeptide (TPR) repeat protein
MTENVQQQADRLKAEQDSAAKARAEREEAERERARKAEKVAPHLRAGRQRFEKGELDLAEREFRRALDQDPECADALFNLGMIYRDREQMEEAADYFHRTLKLAPKMAYAYNNLGFIDSFAERWDSAEENFRKAIELAFQFPMAHHNLGMLLLRKGNFREGFKECEWRWQTPGFNPIRCLQPRWEGDPIDALLVHTEQGAGDTFQFCRFLPEIRKRCKKVIFFCAETMLCMFRNGEWADDIRIPGSLNLEEFQAYLPLMSAPYALDLDIDNIPTDVPYLTPEPRTVELGPVHVADARLKVGICWGGSTTHKNDHHRSCALKRFATVFNVPGVAYYSLQKGPQVAELKELGEQAAVVRDLDEAQKDFADTAAILDQLDLTISVDTAVLHLAGGLGRPVWGLLSRNHDWRWMIEREDSPWYPTLKLFRQKTLDDWDELTQRVAGELRAVVEGRQPLPGPVSNQLRRA